MGEMADYTNDGIADFIEDVQQAKDAGDFEALYDMGVIDEMGYEEYTPGQYLPIDTREYF